MIDTYALLIGIVLFGGYGAYRVYKALNKKTHISESQNLNLSQEQKAQDSKIEKRKPKPVYKLQTHNIKYWLYNPSYSFRTYSLIGLYNDLIIKNLWINEPFHSKIYEILMVLDKNEFMIADPHSRVITMNVRGQDNQLFTSKSFQVFTTRDIVVATFNNAMIDIVRFDKHDAQNIAIAICVIALEQSLHYQSNEASLDTIKTILNGYAFTEDVHYISDLVKESDKQLQFVDNAFKIAFQTSRTYAYNDSEVPRTLQLQINLPQKVLKEA